MLLMSSYLLLQQLHWNSIHLKRILLGIINYLTQQHWISTPNICSSSKISIAIIYLINFIFSYRNIAILFTGSFALWAECSPMVQEPRFNPTSCHTKDFKKWDLISPCLTLSTIRYVSKVEWSNSAKKEAPSPTPWSSSYWKRSLLVALKYSRQLLYKVSKL